MPERRDAAVDAVILDLGGVICRFDFALAYELWRERLGGVTLAGSLEYDTQAFRFERGEITSEEFADHTDRVLGGHGLSTSDFLDGWNAIFQGLVPGVHGLIETLSHRTRLVVLSNTNRAHADFWREAYSPTLAHVERIFCSHEIGHRKPEPGAYRAVLDYLGLGTGRVVFFDDVREFVAGALDVGIAAHQVESTASIENVLARLGVLEPAG